MPFSGGTFSRLYNWVTEQASSPIEISKLDAQETDIATALSTCILRDGTGVPTADINWNGKKITSLGAATAATEAINLGQVQKNSTNVLGSVAGTNTITAALSPTLGAYSAGMLVVLTPAATNTGAVTLNIDSLGALDIVTYLGAAITPGALAVGFPALLLLDAGADDFVLINPVGTGSFTGTLTGYASGPSGTVTYKINNGMCTLYTGVEISGTSNSTALTMTGLPTAVRPSGTRDVPSTGFVNNSLTNSYVGSASIAAAGTITFKLLNISNGLLGTNEFVASGQKGLSANWSITYPLI